MNEKKILKAATGPIRRFIGDFLEHISDENNLYNFKVGEILEQEEGWKRIYRNPKWTFGLDGAHRLTPIWEKVALIAMTLNAFFWTLLFALFLIAVFACLFLSEFNVWWRERIKEKRRAKAVAKIMAQRKKNVETIVTNKKAELY
jgi:hypothetical protein